VSDSQVELFREIERLSGGMHCVACCFALLLKRCIELQKFAESSKTPQLDSYIQKLQNARRRVAAINTTLKTAQDRLDRIYSTAGRRKPGA